MRITIDEDPGDTITVNGIKYRKVEERTPYSGNNQTLTAEKYLEMYTTPDREDRIIFGRMMANAYRRKYDRPPYVIKPEKNRRSGGLVYVYEIPQDMMLLDATFIRFMRNKRNRE